MNTSGSEHLPQSQLDQLLEEWVSSFRCPDSANQNDNNFQNKFLSTILGDNYENGNSNLGASNQHKKPTQILHRTVRDGETIDVEEILPTFLLNSQRKPDYDIPQTDFETFLENKWDIVSINCTNNGSKEPHLPVKRENNWYNEPMPLLIEDILSIKATENFFDIHSLYGQSFKKVIFYGRVSQSAGTAKDKRDIRCYDVDDGTGSITVRYSHNCTRLEAVIKGVEVLKYKYAIALKEGVPMLGIDNYHPNTPVCRDLLNKVGIVISVIDRNIAEARKHIKTGNKAYVAGIPYFDTKRKKLCVFAFDMLEDASPNRDTEINFKKRIISLYESRYAKYSKDGDLLNKT